MSNGYLLTAEADNAVAHEIADGFGLDVISADTIGDQETIGAALTAAANVGLILSAAAAQDEAFVALLQALAQKLPRAQLILVEADARAAFAFLPEAWPAMPLEEARLRASELARQRAPTEERSDAQPPPPATAAPQPPAAEESPLPGSEQVRDDALSETPPSTLDSRYGDMRDAMGADRDAETELPSEAPAIEATPTPSDAAPEAPAAAAPPPAAEPPPVATPPAPEPPTLAPPEAPPRFGRVRDVAPPAPQAPAPAQAPPQTSGYGGESHSFSQTRAGRRGATAPADATAFAPKKLRRETPELVRIVIHQPKDLQAVIKAARKVDPRAEPAPQGMSIGEVALGARIGVMLEARGARCDGELQRRTWAGEPIDFSFSVEAEAGVKQAVFLARVFIDDAQIGVLAFTRGIRGPAKKPAGVGDRVRLKRHKRVFLSYSSNDREIVSAIAVAYQMAGVPHFWDRASLKSGEEWSPRLRREIDRADLFHLCWSRAASQSEWVHKETEHALTRRRRTNGRQPQITVQMLDGPPWAPHPPHLDAINFDDFVRAAMVGYARGDGS